MESGVMFLIFICFSVAKSEIHTLEYVYTALSKPVDVPGVYEFIAMGILDDKQIDYYNSKDKTKIPRQMWMNVSLDNNYWEKGTLSRKSKEQWFKVNVEILMKRMNHSKENLHVLQWRHGCQGEPQPGGTLAFLKGFDQYSYDGGDFLSFDPEVRQWVAPAPQALPTKTKWDDSHTLNQYTDGYLKRECMDWLNKFMTFGEKDLKNLSAPMVFAHHTTAKTPGKLLLHCLATGLHSRDVEVNIYRNNDRMTEADGVTSTGIRPSEFSDDGTMAKTYQLKKSIEIDKSDLSIYSCKVTHRTLDEPIIAICELSWTWQLRSIILAVTLLSLLSCIVAVILFLRKRNKGNCVSVLRSIGSKKSVSSNGSSTPESTETEEQKPMNGAAEVEV